MARGEGVGDGSGTEKLTVSCVVCRVSFRLVFSEGKEKEALKGKMATQRESRDVGKRLAKTRRQAYEGDELEFLTSANWSSGKRLEAFAALGTYRAGLIGVHDWDGGTNILLEFRGELQG